MQVINFQVETEILDEFDDLCLKLGKTRAAHIRSLIRAALDDYRKTGKLNF